MIRDPKGFYTEIPHIETILPRKLEIEQDQNLIIQGITQSGKTSVLFDYIQKLDDSYLYIDFDEVENPEKVLNQLSDLVKEFKVNYLFLDLYSHSFEEVELPDVKQTVVCSWRVQKRSGFIQKQLYPLSFEEFLVFKNSTESLEHTFSRYAKVGGFPIFAKLSDYFLFKQVKRLFYFALSDIELEILADIAPLIGQSRSRLQIFLSLKSRLQLSKDRFYRVFQELVDNSYIITSEEVFGHNNRKRFYFIDPAIKSSFGQRKSFIKLFENLIASELYKRGFLLKYYGSLDFYIANSRGVQPKPFISEEEIEEYSRMVLKSTKKLNLTHLEIITVSFDTSINVDGVVVDAISFSRWALLL